MRPCLPTALGVVALLLVGCASPQLGSVVVVAPGGKFSCRAPKMIGLHQAQGDQNGAALLSFSDDFGKLLQIEQSDIPPIMAAKFNSSEQPDTLEKMYDEVVMRQMFRALSPDASTLYRVKSVTTPVGPAFFAMALIPGGSTLGSIDQQGKRLDSVRGVVLFVHGSSFYVVSNQEWPPPSPHSGSVEDRAGKLLAELKEDLSGMSFNDVSK
jgi:hypothetical protein